MEKSIRLSLMIPLILVASLATFAQRTDEYWGCGVRDFKCQLDKRMAALKADPKNPENYYNLGIVFLRSGNCKQAIESFSMYLAIPGVVDPLRADGLNNRGICYRRLGRPELALVDHTEAIRLVPKNASFYVNRANDNMDLKRPDDALADYGRAIAVDPKFALAYANRGNHLYGTGKINEALLDLNKAIELDPKNPEPFYTRALLYRSRSEFERAILDLDRYLLLGVDNPQYAADAHVNRAIAYAMTNRLEDALKDATRAIELAPKYVDAYRVRAQIYRELKKRDLAQADEAKADQLAKAP